jgi:hypothetical protein
MMESQPRKLTRRGAGRIAAIIALLTVTTIAVPAATAVGQSTHRTNVQVAPIADRSPADGPVLVPPGTGSPELEQLRRAVSDSSAGATTAAEDPQCWTNVTIRSHGNNLYVAAEQDPGFLEWGMLRARTQGNALGTWELFSVCRNAANWLTAIMSHNQHGVDVETSVWDTRRGLLRAQVCCYAVSVFTTLNPPGSGYSTWFYSTEVGLYVSAQLDYPGDYHASLRARLGQVGPWEWFTW